MANNSRALLDATHRYAKKTYDQIPIRIRKDAEFNADVIRAHAAACGESLNAFILRAVEETMARDNAK